MMSGEAEYAVLCRIICVELGELIHALSRGGINQQRFTERVLHMEMEKISPCGFTLSSANTLDDWAHFTLKWINEKCVCATFEFHPETGELRQFHSGL